MGMYRTKGESEKLDGELVVIKLSSESRKSTIFARVKKVCGVRFVGYFFKKLSYWAGKGPKNCSFSRDLPVQ